MTGLIIAILLGWAGGYQFYQKKNGMGVLYLFTFGLFGIGWILDILKAYSKVKVAQERKEYETTITQGKTFRNDIERQMYIDNTVGYRESSDRRDMLESLFYPYREEVDRIEAAWSVISNLKDYNGQNAIALERLCYDNIEKYLNLEKFRRECGYAPDNYCPAYIRLAMLYEKQGEYQKGIDVCVNAIKNGAYEDKSNGKMYGRLARLIKKSGIDVSPDIIKLSLLQ